MHILLHPGLNNSGELHWQTIWEKTFGYERILQDEWDAPVRDVWVARIEETVSRYNPAEVVLVGHSLACSTIVHWAHHYGRTVRGALLVAPSDTEVPSYPEGTTGFKPMPLWRLPFPSIVVNSSDDVYVSPARARQFADAWGSEYVEVDGLGHINAGSGIGMWEFGLELLRKL